MPAADKRSWQPRKPVAGKVENWDRWKQGAGIEISNKQADMEEELVV